MLERLTGPVRPYAWGSPTLIPELLGVEPTGEPQAELWLGAHPSDPATVAGVALTELIRTDPTGTLGSASVATFGPQLPFLLKVLAAGQPLSLQAHPTREQAEAGFDREEAASVHPDAPDRLYQDRWPKPELLCALVPTETLCGFRDPLETHGLFHQLGAAEVLNLVAPLADDQRDPTDRLATVFGQLLRLAPDRRDVIRAVVSRAQSVPAGPGGLARFAQTARDLGPAYGEDPGLLAALLLNRVSLAPNEAIFLPAGNLHAYLRGGGIEIMASSDNVLRGGLTPKQVDVEELLSILDFRPGFAGLVQPVEDAPGVWRYPVPAPEFTLWRVEVAAAGVTLPADGSARVVLVTEGALTLTAGHQKLPLERGQSAFVGADDHVRVAGRGTAFVGGSGLTGLDQSGDG